MKKPVLFLIFNRLDTTQKVFEQIRIAKPPRLYLASDGAREAKEGEEEIVASVRKWVLENIDWPCEVKTLFRDENLGCGKAVSGAISWFFSQEECGIILEDDCLPSLSFFPYCEELLDHYKDDKRVWHIAGYNPLDICENGASYYFAKIQHCWGWASWADRWQNYNFDLANFANKYIQNFSDDNYTQKYWLNILKKMKNHDIDTWDYQWTFEIAKNKGLCICPTKNLVSNIGYDGAHYSGSQNDSRLNAKTYEIEKFVHPSEIKIDEAATNLIYKKSLNIDWKKDIVNYIKLRPFFLFKKDFWGKFFVN